MGNFRAFVTTTPIAYPYQLGDRLPQTNLINLLLIMKKYTFNVSEPTLKISANSNIAISPSKDGLIQIEVTGSDKAIENIAVKQTGNTILIEDRSGSGLTIISHVGNMSFSGGVSNISMVDGDIHVYGGGSVYANGKRIDLDGDRAKGKEPYKATLITIYAPFADLDLALKGLAKFASSQHFDSVYADLSGTTQAVFSANNIELDLSGCSNVKAEIKNGDLVADVSGSSEVTIIGDFKSCKADASGSSKISTSGTCFGDYKADASGCSRIRHKGAIQGRSRERRSGVASIDI